MSTSDALEQYPNTVLEFAGGDSLDLRHPVGRDEREVLERHGLLAPFAVLTAENPRGRAPAGSEERKERVNDARTRSLNAELDLRMIPWQRVDGVAPDGSHRERCLAICAEREEAEDLALRFEQLAVFWFDGGRFWVWPALAPESPQPLP